MSGLEQDRPLTLYYGHGVRDLKAASLQGVRAQGQRRKGNSGSLQETDDTWTKVEEDTGDAGRVPQSLARAKALRQSCAFPIS